MRFKLLATNLLLLSLLLGSTAASAAKSKVLFLSNPKGVTVTDALLGELGTTPFELNLKRGTVLECTFSKPGFESRTITRTVDALRLEVRADLPARPATSVRLGVEPRHATVRLSSTDGTEIYSGESGRVHTLPGDLWGAGTTARFHLEAWAPGYRTLEESLTLTKHEQHPLTFTLEELSTVLSVTSEPEGARVTDQFLGDLGVTPLETRVTLVQLLRARSRANAQQGDPARVVLTLSKPGFEGIATQVALDFERAENTVAVALEPLGPSPAR